MKRFEKCLSYLKLENLVTTKTISVIKSDGQETSRQLCNYYIMCKMFILKGITGKSIQNRIDIQNSSPKSRMTGTVHFDTLS